MAFSVGDLIARLRMDSKEFDAGVQKAQAGLKTVEAAAGKADRAVGMSQRAINAYTGAQRLSTAEISNAVKAYDGHTRAAVYNTRAVVLQHMKALEMNAAFDAGATATRRSSLNMAQFSNALRTAAVQMTGMNPVAGRLLSTVGQFAAGTGVMIGVFAGLAGLGALWRQIGKDAREARERLEAALTTLEKLALARRTASIGGETGVAVRLAIQEVNRLKAEQAALDDMPLSSFGEAMGAEVARRAAEFERIGLRITELNDLIAAGEESLAADATRAADEVAAALAKEAHEMEVAALDADNLRRRLQGLAAQMDAITDKLKTGLIGGMLVPKVSDRRINPMSFVSRVPDFFGGRGGDERIGGVQKSVNLFHASLLKAKDAVHSFGEGAKASLKNFVDVGALGANFAGQGIGMVVGMLGDALFGPKYINAIEENTRALRRMSGDTSELEKVLSQLEAMGRHGDLQEQLRDTIANSAFQSRLDLLRMRTGALDLSANDQFAALRGILQGQIGGSLGAQVGALTPESAGEFLANILEQLAAGTFDVGALGRTPLADFLDVLAEMESLGDAAGDAAGELGDLASTIRNAPAGFKANFARYQADTGVPMGDQTKGDKGIVIEGDVVIVTDDPDRFGERLRQQTRRGGTTALQLATRPAGGFVRGGV